MLKTKNSGIILDRFDKCYEVYDKLEIFKIYSFNVNNVKKYLKELVLVRDLSSKHEEFFLLTIFIDLWTRMLQHSYMTRSTKKSLLILQLIQNIKKK